MDEVTKIIQISEIILDCLDELQSVKEKANRDEVYVSTNDLFQRYQYVVACAGLDDSGIIDDLDDFETVIHACIMDFPTEGKEVCPVWHKERKLNPVGKLSYREGNEIVGYAIVRTNDEKTFGYLCDFFQFHVVGTAGSLFQ